MADTLTLEPRVRKIIADHLGQFVDGKAEPKAFEWGDTLASMGADSLDIIELSIALEEEFDVHIDDEAIEGWATATDLLRTVEALR